MLKIYGIPTFNTVKVLLTAEYLSLKYEYIPVDLTTGAHKTPEFLAMNPMGRVPVIEQEGFALSESNAICRYLAEVNDNKLFASDAAEKAQINQWVDSMALHAGRWLGVHFFEEYIRPTYFKLEPKPKALEEAGNFLQQQLPVIEAQLGKSPYLAGTELSIADTIAFAYFYSHEQSSVDLAPYPNISRWYKGIRASEAFKRTEAVLATQG